MKTDSQKRIFFILQIIITILEIIGFIIAIGKNGISIMGYYTQDSNLVMLIAAACYSIYTLFHRDGKTPKWIMVLMYVATCMVTVTFVTVVLVLVPMYVPYGGVNAVLWLLIGGSNLFHHLLAPVIAMTAFLFFEHNFRPDVKTALLAASPTLLYACISTALNAAKVVRGPYPFLYVYEQPLWVSVAWFIAIPGGAFLFALLFGVIKRKTLGKAHKL